MRPPPLRRATGVLVVASSLAVPGCREEVPSDPVRLGDPLPGLSETERGRFLLGRALFERVTSPDEGLGPLYNAERCSACHEDPAVGGGGTAVPVLKATRFVDGACDLLIAYGGDNVQQRATDLLLAQGMGPEEVPAAATDTVRVVAPPLYGLGLVEAVPDSALESRADPDDLDGDGISGRVPRAADGRVARFGRKGDAVDLPGFIDTALRFELGLTTPAHPREETRNGRPVPPEADPGRDPEIDRRGLALLVDFVRYLAPPRAERIPPGPVADSVARGRVVFAELGCARCHVPELATGESVAEPLRDRPVRLYSDLLLHDLGSRTGLCGTDASPGEYRTAPLWGLRHRTRYLHDGSATSLSAALARHGGEARAARDAFLGAPEDVRALLMRFLSVL